VSTYQAPAIAPPSFLPILLRSFSILPISTSSSSSSSSGSVSATGSASILPINVSSTTGSSSSASSSSVAGTPTVSQAGVLPTALVGIEKLVAAVMVGLAGVAML